jgi:hypothetical protein
MSYENANRELLLEQSPSSEEQAEQYSRYQSGRPWRVTLRLCHLGVDLIVDPSKTKIIGSRPSVNGSIPDINLYELGGTAHGVVEQHLVLGMGNSGLYVMDQGSEAGSRLNNIRLVPHQPYPLHDGDTLYLGYLQINVHIFPYPY